MIDETFEYCRHPVLIMGCGNILYGDDGFGPAVIRHIQENMEIPEGIHILDAGAGARNIVFNITVSDIRPKAIIIIDAVTAQKREPGELFELTLEELEARKADDFFMHMVPTSNMLVDLRDKAGIDVILFACQAGHIPEVDMEEGLSPQVEVAVQKMAEAAMTRGRTLLEGRK